MRSTLWCPTHKVTVRHVNSTTSQTYRRKRYGCPAEKERSSGKCSNPDSLILPDLPGRPAFAMPTLMPVTEHLVPRSSSEDARDRVQPCSQQKHTDARNACAPAASSRGALGDCSGVIATIRSMTRAAVALRRVKPSALCNPRRAKRFGTSGRCPRAWKRRDAASERLTRRGSLYRASGRRIPVHGAKKASIQVHLNFNVGCADAN